MIMRQISSRGSKSRPILVYMYIADKPPTECILHHIHLKALRNCVDKTNSPYTHLKPMTNTLRVRRTTHWATPPVNKRNRF